MHACLVRVRDWIGDLVWTDDCDTSYMFVCVCVCLFRSVILTLNPKLTLLPNPNYYSILARVQRGTPRCCQEVLKIEDIVGPQEHEPHVSFLQLTITTNKSY